MSNTKHNFVLRKKAGKIIPGIICFIMVISTVFSWAPVTSAAALRGSDKLSTVNTELTAQYYDYFNEIYLKRYPDFGTQYLFGSDYDNAIMEAFVERLTQGLKTDAEKADMIIKWIDRYLTYESRSPYQYPIDVFYERVTNCMGYATLMQQFFKSAGIPAVFATGFIGDLNSITFDQLFARIYDSHAWVYAYFDGAWRMYDPLFGVRNSTDIAEQSENHFIQTCEGVAVYNDRVDVRYNSYAVYKDGKFYCLTNGKTSGSQCGCGQFMNNIQLISDCEMLNSPHGIYPDSEAGIKIKPQIGEIYCNGLYYKGSEITYSYPNGVTPAGRIFTYDGKTVFCYANTFRYYLEGENTYTMKHGCLTIKMGESLQPILMGRFESLPECIGCEVEYTSTAPDIVAVDENGLITGKAVGEAMLSKEIRRSENICMMTEGFNVLVVDGERKIPPMDFNNGGEKSIAALFPKALAARDHNGMIFVGDNVSADRLTSLIFGDVSVSSDELKTGVQLSLKDENGAVLDSRTVIVVGDTDCNGKTTSADARAALRASVGLETFDKNSGIAADIDGDRAVTSADARLILRLAVKLDTASKLIDGMTVN